MSYGIGHYTGSWHGDLGPGKRPDELAKPDPNQLLSAEAAGRLAGLSSGQIRKLVRRGELPAEMKAGKWFIRRVDAEGLRGAS